MKCISIIIIFITISNTFIYIDFIITTNTVNIADGWLYLTAITNSYTSTTTTTTTTTKVTTTTATATSCATTNTTAIITTNIITR